MSLAAAQFPAYPLLVMAGIVVSVIIWTRMAKSDQRLPFIYIGGLVGAFLGAKLVYLLAEGFLHWGKPDFWQQLLVGKSILGALLGGYAGVELVKHWVGHTAPTGDRFALVAPIGIILGRFGCLLHGCCLGKACEPTWYTLRDAQGIARWPSVPLEIGFNLAALVVFWGLRRAGKQTNQHFHIYLMAYGFFRFEHEFVRDTPRLVTGISGYQVAALTVFLLGFVGYHRRARTGL